MFLTNLKSKIIVEVTVGPVGVKFNPQEIVDILHQLSSYFNRDKNSVCLALALIKRNIMDWENEINSIVIDQMSNHLSKTGEKLPKGDIHAIFSITEYPVRKDAGAESLLQLKNIENDYYSGKLQNILDKHNIESINRIQYLLNGEDLSLQGNAPIWIKDEVTTPEEQARLRRGFITLARDDTDVWNLDNILKGYGGKQEAEQLRSWLRSLEKIKYLLMLEISSINHSLGCRQEGVNVLLEQIRNKKNA